MRLGEKITQSFFVQNNKEGREMKAMGLPIFPNRWHCEDWLQKISKKIFILLDLFSRYRILPSDQPVTEATGNGPKNPGKKIFSNPLSLIFRSV